MSPLSVWESIGIGISLYFSIAFLDDLGKRIVIMDLAIMMGLLTCVVVPIIFYHSYTKENYLARLWVKYMPVSSNDYFSFVVPAMVAMIIGLRVPLGKLQINKTPEIYLKNVKNYLATRPRLGLILIGVGVTASLLDFLSPASLVQVFYLIAHLTYVGVFYVIYSPSKQKGFIVPFVISLMLGQSIITGMFGDLINMLACSVVLILLGRKLSFRKKLVIAVGGFFFILVIQSIKFDYRSKIHGEHSGADPIYFASLITDKIADPSTIFEPIPMFGIAMRLNQGWLIATTMDRVPRRYPFAYGETIWQSVAAAIMPRFLWPDKPEAGGKANLKRFWGYDIRGYSMNIGPLGEAYGNFNVEGGIVYIFFYGVFFNLLLAGIIKLAEKRPTLILWLPFLFFYTITMETDLLTTMGSLIKAVLFTWIVFRVFKTGFRIDL
ncbi:MAG TPA: hypothetical protein VKR53_11025 [Puia sp.]|nr:hypothetical protein [Puia sp.]